ncbi:MAG: hypothetical protein JWN38_593 [Candidatus Saccharibacteria bacterium]|nr:hypothetical protein [Candidatus Saccharibacteria bacterium]
MEAGPESLFVIGIDAQARNQSLEIVEAAEDSAALLLASKQHFNERVTSLDAERVLAELDDDRLSPLLQTTVGFDPVLYKAAALFELSHLSGDESALPDYLQELSNFWRGENDLSAEDLERGFTAETKRARYEPFPVLSLHVLLLISAAASSRMAAPVEALEEPKDPLKEAIDGKDYKIILGGRVLKFDEHPVLTRQLERDLTKLFPRPVVQELRYRFPENGTFGDVYSLLTMIQTDRQNGVLPPDDELVAAYQRERDRQHRTFNVRRPLSECTVEQARDRFIARHRDPQARTYTQEYYVPALGRWFSTVVLESDTEVATCYRRIFYGDRSDASPVEVPLDSPDRQVVYEEIAREHQEAVEAFGGNRTADTVYDCCDSFDV